MSRLSYIALIALLSGCMFADQNTIGGLSESQEEETNLDFENLDHEGVREEYRELLELVDDAYLKEQIQRRIAGVYMHEGDDKQTRPNAAPKRGYYRDAIQSYVDILEKYPNSPDNAEVLYQLAKAYDMEGQTKNALKMMERLVEKHPYFHAIAEVYFRMGDIYFSHQKYKKAEQSYRSTTREDSGKLLLNAHYMLAWTLYKRGYYNDSLDSFAYVLDELMVRQQGRALSKTEKPLVDDTLHSMSLALINSDGASGIEDIGMLQNKPYVWRLYEKLGDFYLEKQRYDDSAKTFRRFVDRFSDDQRAPHFHSKLISAYLKGGFPKQVLNEKETFVSLYGMGSPYWVRHGEAAQKNIKPDLNTYIKELASHYHSEGQQFLKKSNVKDKSKAQERRTLAGNSFSRATQLYASFVSTFPKDKDTDKMLYLKAEAHFQAEQFEQAALDYETVAYDYKSKSYRNKAGYAAIVAFQKHTDTISDDKKLSEWRQKAVESMLRFAKVFHSDKRSPTVLTNAAEYLFSLNQYDKAISVSKDLIEDNKKLDKSLKETAFGIIAHSYFKLEQYALAESNYLAQRALINKKAPEYAEVTDRLAAAIYKGAEVMAQQEKQDESIKKMLSIKKHAPKSNVRVVAQFDAASMLMEQKKWKFAIRQLTDLNQNFKSHELSPEFPRKLAFAYEQNKQWKRASEAYLFLYVNDKDENVKREALFIAAGLFEKVKDYDTAIERFKEYAHRYEQPFDDRMEARFHLANLYLKIDDKTRHLYWLRRVIDGDLKGGDMRTDRSKWLGAWANAKYGDYFAWEFKRRKLRQPLEVSLQRKNQHLQDATARYEKAASYGILEFVTLSSYRIAELYEKFAIDLKNSPRPQGLSAAEKKEYEQIIVEQSQPFTELSANIHHGNVERAWGGEYNPWIEKSFKAMARLMPERFNKVELEARYGDEIR